MNGCIIHLQHSIFKDNLEELKDKLFSQQIGVMNQGFNIQLTPELYAENVYQLHASQINQKDVIYDIGPNSLMDISNMILNSDKIIWNGPPGVYEINKFQNGTNKIIKSIINSEAEIKVAGGGSTVAAINYFDSSEYFSHISTGGGAFLSLLEGKFLQGIEVLKV